MSSASWKVVGAAGVIVGALVTIHGITSRGWRDLHTIGLVLSVAAAVAPRLR
jgi:hypothetical protein